MTPAQCLAWKVDQNLSDAGYQRQRNLFPAYLLPKKIVKKYEEKLLEGSRYEDIYDGDAQKGVRVGLKEIIKDAIESGKWGLVKDKRNLMKITGDGAILHKNRSITAFFLQTLMKSDGGQSLESITPLGIIVGKVKKKVTCSSLTN